MVRALQSWGCVVQTAGDYDAAAAAVAARPIDLIIADYRLPRGCNGVQAARRLRAMCGACVPVLIVTADIAVYDGTGKYLTPGIIDIHSHLGDYPSPSVDAHSDGNEATSPTTRSEEHTSELQSLMRISYAGFCI